MVQASKYYQFEVKGNIWKWLNVKASDGNKRYIILFYILHIYYYTLVVRMFALISSAGIWSGECQYQVKMKKLLRGTHVVVFRDAITYDNICQDVIVILTFVNGLLHVVLL